MFFEDRMFKTSVFLTFKYVLMFVPVKLVAAFTGCAGAEQEYQGDISVPNDLLSSSIVGSSVAMAVTWKMVLSREGFVNVVLGYLHLGPIDFLSSPSYALETLAMMGAWQFGSSMVIFLAGLKQVPQELYEAADVDGTKKMRQFFSITLPMISSTILFNLVMGLINAFQVFTQIAVITNGGPADSTYVYMLHLYRTAFVSHRMGYSSALAWVLTLIILATTGLVFLSSKRWVYYRSRAVS